MAERCRLSVLGQNLLFHLLTQIHGTDRLFALNYCKSLTCIYEIYLFHLETLCAWLQATCMSEIAVQSTSEF